MAPERPSSRDMRTGLIGVEGKAGQVVNSVRSPLEQRSVSLGHSVRDSRTGATRGQDGADGEALGAAGGASDADQSISI